MSALTAPWAGRPAVRDGDLDQLLCLATRYALGRATYVVGWVVDLLVAHEPWISERCRDVLVRDIREAFRMGAVGMDIDAEQWRRALRVLARTEAEAVPPAEGALP